MPILPPNQQRQITEGTGNEGIYVTATTLKFITDHSTSVSDCSMLSDISISPGRAETCVSYGGNFRFSANLLLNVPVREYWNLG